MSHKTKLELTRIGKNDELHIEPLILIESDDLSYSDPETENILIHGDNFLALKVPEQENIFAKEYKLYLPDKEELQAYL